MKHLQILEERKITFIAFVCTGLLVLFFGIPNLLLPLGRDQGAFAYGAIAFLNGQVLYTDLFVAKPPMTYLINALALTLFGHEMISIRLFDVFWHCISALIILLTANVCYQKKHIGMLAAIIYALLYFSFDFWNTAQTDGFLTLPLSLSMLLFLIAQKNERWWAYGLSGLSLGLAFLLKYPVAIFLTLLLAITLMVKKDSKGRSYSLIAGFLGFSTPIVIFLFYLFINNAVESFIYVHDFLAKTDWSFGRFQPFNFFVFLKDNLEFLIIHLAFVLMVAYLLIRRSKLQDFLIVFWAVAAILHVIVQNKYYLYHFLPILAPLCILASFLLFQMAERYLQYSSRLAIPIILVLFLSLGLASYKLHYSGKYRTLYSIVSGKTQLQTFYRSSDFETQLYSVRTRLEVSDFIRNKTHIGDKIFVWGTEPIVYFLSGRECASRFIFNASLFRSFGLDHQRKELLQDLNLARPRYILVVTGDSMAWATGSHDDSFQAFLKFPELRNFVEAKYEQTHVISDFIIYERKAPS